MVRDSYTPSLVKLGLNLQSVDEIWVYGTDYGGGGRKGGVRVKGWVGECRVVETNPISCKDGCRIHDT